MQTTIKNDAFTLLQFSDLHLFEQTEKYAHDICPEQSFLKIFEQAIETHPAIDLILITGDLAEDPVETVYNRLKERLSWYQIPIVCLPGNHDNYPVMLKTFSQPPMTCNKLTRLGNWQIIALNSQIVGEKQGAIAIPEMAFLQDTLSISRDYFSVIALHHHCIPTGSSWMNHMQLEQSEQFLKTLQNYNNVKLILSGHTHQILDTHTAGTAILGTPSTCYQFKPNSKHFAITQEPPCYRSVTLFPDGEITSTINTLTPR
ncbi:MAG: metallophosphoesterase [Methylococcales bacterium]|jgi:Icc protein|nr:metallophosphoesterase [Methylococcales bacterium]